MILPGIFAAVVTVLVWILAQVLLFGFVDPKIRFRLRLFLYGISFLFFLVWQSSTALLNLFNGILLHLLLFCTFMEFYYCIDRPVTLRILAEAKKSADHILRLDKLYRSYDLEYMIGRRLEALMSSGYLFKKEDRYYLTSKGKFFAGIFEKGSALFGVNRGT